MPTSSPTTSTGAPLIGVVGAAIAVSAWGTTGVLIKAIDLDPVAISFYRFTLYSTLVAVVMSLRGRPPGWRALIVAAPGGLFLGGDVVLFFTAVKMTSVVNATTIGALQPILVLAIAARMFSERITGREIAAAAGAIAGVIVIVSRSSGTPQWSGTGDLAALGALFCWTGYLVMAKKAAGQITPSQYTIGTGFWTAVVSLPVGLIAGQDMSVPNPGEWGELLVLVMVGGLLGHSVMNASLPRIPLWLGSVMTLLVPVVASLIAWAALGEALDAVQIGAIVAVVGALAIVVLSQQQPTPVTPPQAPLTSGVDAD